MACRFFATIPVVSVLAMAACSGESPGASPKTLTGASTDSSGSVSSTDPDSERRTTPHGESWLEDATDDWNLHFTHRSGSSGELVFPEMMGGGIAVFDANNDGALDLYFVSGAPNLGRAKSSIVNRLFLQGKDGRFVDATEASGLGDSGYGTGVAIADMNNDGFQDVFVSNFGPDRLYRGRGDGTFEDVTRQAGITATGTAPDDWSSSAVFCDIDLDGYLDLYVVRYVVFDPGVECTDSAGRREYCGPDSFEDRTDVLLRNRGDGTFEDISSEAGIDRVTGAGLGVVCEDLDDDGWVDIYVANDGDPNQLWMNQGDGTFIDDALILGASVNAAGLDEAGMGVVAADFDNDADLDLFVTHLRDETNTFYRNLGDGLGFEDQTARLGLAVASTPYTGFGAVAVDLDLDGDLDLLIANGRVLRGAPLTDKLPGPWNPYAEPNLVYSNDAGKFRLLTDRVRSFVVRTEVSRGLATGDLDGDGALDVIVSSIESPVRLYRGTPPTGHWLLVDAVDPRLSRRALGARVTLFSGNGARRLQVRSIQGAMSYLSSSDPRAHFGLGADDSAVSIRIRWPDGLEETWSDLAVDQALVLRRGDGSR